MANLEQICSTCSLQAIPSSIQEVCKAVHITHDEEESTQIEWYSDLKSIANSSETCPLCQFIIQGLQDSRRQLVEDIRFSGDWEIAPEDLDHDILTIPYYLEAGGVHPTAVASLSSPFEKKNNEGLEKIHVVLRVECYGKESGMGDGYRPIISELRIASKNGNATFLSPNFNGVV